MLLKMGWRNIWRNYKRTVITALALVMALTLMILYSGLTKGLLLDLKHTVTRLTVGDYQIHHPKFLDELSIYDTVENQTVVIEQLRNLGMMATPRWYGYALMASDETGKSVGVEIQAISPTLEKTVTEISDPQNLYRGKFLSGRAETQPSRQRGGAPLIIEEVVLGKKVAESLGTQIGSLVVLVTTGSDGSIGNELFRVVGVLKNVGDTFDRTRVIMSQSAYSRLFSFNLNQAHEIALRVSAESEISAFKDKLKRELAQPLEIKHWGEIVPLVYDMFAFIRVASTIVMLIIYMSAGLVILNSILMMVFERVREFGIMRALGYQRRHVIQLVMIETLMLTLISTLLGVMLGYFLNQYMVHVGIDLSGFAPNGYDFSGTTLQPVLHSMDGGVIFVKPIILLFLVTLLSALYPAVRAARLNPVQAIYRRG